MSGGYASTAPGLGGDRAPDRDARVERRWLRALKHLRRNRAVMDADWDLGYPARYAQLSSVHWSPVAVARRAAQLLSRGPATRVLDVGSGVGKFCLIATLTAQGTFVGVERCGEMVDVARVTARRARSARARFVHARVEDIDWSLFNGFYFFNPFHELQGPSLRLVGSDPFEPAEYRELITFTQQRLEEARTGTRVVTYHGFGGEMPKSFKLVVKEPQHTDFIECWERE
jgi:SAM-dependent methyltransferase